MGDRDDTCKAKIIEEARWQLELLSPESSTGGNEDRETPNEENARVPDRRPERKRVLSTRLHGYDLN